jgi:hypothetical protein
MPDLGSTDEFDPAEAAEAQLRLEIEQECDLPTVAGYPADLLIRSLAEYIPFLIRNDWNQGYGDEAIVFIIDILKGIKLSPGDPRMPYEVLVEICDSLNLPPTFCNWSEDKLAVFEELWCC